MGYKKGWYKHSETTKKKMSLSAIKTWKRGRFSWNKGKTKKTDLGVQRNAEKISQALKGRPKSEEHKKKIGLFHRGLKHSPETKEKIRRGVLGNPNIKRTQFKKGHKDTPEINAKKGLVKERNPAWIDGRSYTKHYPLEFRRIRKQIIERDNHQC